MRCLERERERKKKEKQWIISGFFCFTSVSPKRYECLKDALSKSHSTEAEMRAAWAKLTEAEARELGGGEDGEEMGKVEFDKKVEFAPLHWAAYTCLLYTSPSPRD